MIYIEKIQHQPYSRKPRWFLYFDQRYGNCAQIICFVLFFSVVTLSNSLVIPWEHFCLCKLHTGYVQTQMFQKPVKKVRQMLMEQLLNDPPESSKTLQSNLF